MKITSFCLYLLLAAIVRPVLIQAQTPAASPSYFGSSSATASDSGVAPHKAPAVDPALQHELQQLADQHATEVARAAEPINRRYQAALEPLIRRAQDAGDVQTAQKIREIVASLNNLDRTTWHQNGNAWVMELRFKNGIMSVVPRNGNPPRDAAYRMVNDTIIFVFDGNEQRISVAPDRTSLNWYGTVLDRS